MVEQVRRLLGEPLAFERRHHYFDRLLANLLCGIPHATREELRRVRALRHLPAALVYRPGEPCERPAEVRRLLGRAHQGLEETTPLAGVTGRPRRVHPVEQRVTVAIETYLDHPLGVAARLSLAPELVPGPGVVVGLVRLQRHLHSLPARVGQRQDLARLGVLGDNGDETVLVEADALYRIRLAQRTGIPACARCSFTSAMLYSPKWKMLAARTALAPALTAETMCSGRPAPPEAMIGNPVFEATSEMRSRSYPLSVP